jgi:hypothetical protein
MEQRHHGRYVCKEKRDQAGEEFWLREVIFSLDSPDTVTFTLREIRKNMHNCKPITYWEIPEFRSAVHTQ